MRGAETAQRRAGERPAGANSSVVDSARALARFLSGPALSEATRRAYRVDVEEFLGWLDERRLELDDVDVRALSEYVADLGSAQAGRRPSRLSPATIARKVAAVRSFLRVALGPARVPETSLAPRRTRRLPTAPKTDEVEAVLEELEGIDPLALRKRALVELVY